jgi:hypothetical protein
MNKNHTNTKISPSRQGNPDKLVPATLVEAGLPGRCAETKLEFPAGEPDLDALRSVTREWLVPLLVEKFLREQGDRATSTLSDCRPGKRPIPNP